MVEDLILYGVIGSLVIAGGYTALFLYCNGLKGTSFCKFPCEPLIGQCAQKTLRVRKGEKF